MIHTLNVRSVMANSLACFQITQKHIRYLEMVRRWGTRFVNGDYNNTSSVTQKLETLHWKELQERRKRAKVIMFYRIVNHIIAFPPAQYLTPRGVVVSTMRFLLPFSRTQNHQQPFFPSVIRLWNDLPSTVQHWKDSKAASRQLHHIRHFSCNYI